MIAGGNIGDVKSRLQRAQKIINDRLGVEMRCSHRYKSEAWGFSAPVFTNQVLVADTDLSPADVLDRIRAIETELGRDRAAEQAEKERTGQDYASRVIDIDILLYDDAVIDTDDLKIPHPKMTERDFVLTPLCEVMREGRHPVSGLTFAELRDNLHRKI